MIETIVKPSDIQTIGQANDALHILLRCSRKEVLDYLDLIDSEEESYRLIRLLDNGALGQYGNFLAYYAHRRFDTARTYAWKYHTLLEKDRPFLVDHLIQKQLTDEKNNFTSKDTIYLLKVRLHALTMMNRIPAATRTIKEIEANGGTIHADQLAPYLVEMDRLEEAEQTLRDALPLTERATITYVAYADLLAKRGARQEAAEVLREGMKRFPEDVTLQVAYIDHLYTDGAYEEVSHLIPQLLEANPYMRPRNYLVYIQTDTLYRIDRWDELRAWIASYSDVLESTVFDLASLDETGVRNEVKLTPIKQKVNYCVPASIEMILKAAGQEKTQDEVANHIFNRTGSKISTTVDYMKTLGFEAVFFKSTIEALRQLIDLGLPVMLDLMVENSSHVQLIRGYDDRLQILSIQDPNRLEPFYVPYDVFRQFNRMKDGLAIVFIQKDRKHILPELPHEEHEFFREAFSRVDDLDEASEEMIDKFLAFLIRNEEEIYASVLGLSLSNHDKFLPHIDKWRKHVQEKLGMEEQKVALLIANSYMRYGDRESFLTIMKDLKRPSAFSHYLLGVDAYKRDSYADALFHLERSLELDPYQPIAYAYLARCTEEIGRTEDAVDYAETAMYQNEQDDFIVSTYATALLANGQTADALAQFLSLAEADPDNAYYAYEAGRCQLADNEQESVQWFERSIALNQAVPYPYLRLAEIYLEQEDWESAEAVSERGIANVPSEEATYLWLYAGHARAGREAYPSAEQAYKEAAERDPEGHALAFIYEGEAMAKTGRWEQALQSVTTTAERLDSAYYTFRAGAMLFETAESVEEHEIALDVMEKGLLNTDDQVMAFVRRYVDYVENTPAEQRGANVLAELRSRVQDPDLYCYEAFLREQAGEVEKALELLQESLEMNAQNTFPHYRLGLIYKGMEEMDAAIRHFESCLEIEDKFNAAREELFDIYEQLADYQTAKQYAFELLELFPTVCKVERMADWLNEQEKRMVSARLDELEGEVDKDWWYISKSSLLQKREAIQFLSKEESPYIQFRLAKLLVQEKEYKKANEILMKLVEEFPNDESLYPYWAEAMLRSKQNNFGSLPIERLNVPDESRAWISHQLGREIMTFAEPWLEIKDGNYSFFKQLRASTKISPITVYVTTLFKYAFKLEPENASHYVELAKYLWKVDNKQDAKKILALYEYDDFDISRLAGFYSFHDGKRTGKLANFEEALVHFTKITEMHPDYPYGWSWKGDTLLHLGKYDLAKASYDKSLELNPEVEEGHVGLMRVYYFAGFSEKAWGYFCSANEEVQNQWLVEMQDSHMGTDDFVRFIGIRLDEIEEINS
ncbi:tetratricopeptide repeat protein [Sporosarcina sp. Te-1]|uniref:tetratricopeptide repeat protein n=1 Tax=Sporosarcina sp. Te-1 TaxID=2818390 RepID=UPI001A9FEE2B|nr:tetratricopeptide repeat protein [Sporosarcina sp. Te-1]QTD41454.1 tetratricopeptide repeat protein [Sporosarcina sp. Te-1]